MEGIELNWPCEVDVDFVSPWVTWESSVTTGTVVKQKHMEARTKRKIWGVLKLGIFGKA